MLLYGIVPKRSKGKVLKTVRRKPSCGCSHHDGCNGTIYGGRFSGSGKAGIAPAYGANVNIYNALCDNNRWGIRYLSTDNGHLPMKGLMNGCVVANNEQGLIVQDLCMVVAMNTKYSSNDTDKSITGSLTEY